MINSPAHIEQTYNYYAITMQLQCQNAVQFFWFHARIMDLHLKYWAIGWYILNQKSKDIKVHCKVSDF